MAAFWIDCEEIANSQKIIKIKPILQFFDKSLFLVTVSNGLTDSIKDFCTCKITHAYNLCSNQQKSNTFTLNFHAMIFYTGCGNSYIAM